MPDDYTETLMRHREQWEKKPAVRAIYHYWYEKVKAELFANGPTIEIGCGCGNFKEFLPSAMATDYVKTKWSEREVDACKMPFSDESVGNVVGIDVLHHIVDPVRFLNEAERILTAGGRVVLIEPYVYSLWGRVIYQVLHHEPVSMEADFFNMPYDPDQPYPPDYANGATGYLLFWKFLNKLGTKVPRLGVVRKELFSFIAYPMSGGFQPFSVLPASMAKPLSRIEDKLLRPLHASVTGLRMLVVLEKR